MTVAAADRVLLEERGGVLTLTLNRPEARNSLTREMVTVLEAAIQRAEDSQAVRVLVLRGSAGHFCAGADVRELARARAEPKLSGRDPIAELSAAFGRLCWAFARVSVPTVSVLEGTVLGGGFGLCCASDLALAADSATFGLPETSLGVVPAQIAPFLVERLGLAHAKRLALGGGTIDACEALKLGLVHELHASGEALSHALDATLTRLLACAPHATRATKRLLLRAQRETPESAIEHAAAVFSAAVTSHEGAEGSLAFVQKRRPSWDPRNA